VLPRHLGRGAKSILSHADDGAADGAAKVTRPWRDVDADDYANVTPGLICI
jgi:hypothetical protein